MRIVVSGASGFIGRALVPHLRGLGHDVVPLARSGAEDLGAVADWPSGVEAVIHLAALNPARSDRVAGERDALMRANARGTGALAARAAREGVRRFVYASTNLVHGRRDAPVDEDAPLAPQNLYAASKLAGEEALAQAAAGGTMTAVTLRLPPVYGPGGRGGLAEILRVAERRVPLPLGGRSARRSLLSLGNAAHALAHAAGPAAPAGTFLVADGPPWSLGDIVAFARRLRGRPPGLIAAPARLLRRAARWTGRGELAERLFADFVVDDRRWRTASGWVPPESIEDGLRRAVLEVPRPGDIRT